MVAGAFCASMYLSARANGREERIVTWLTGAGAVLTGAGWLVPSLAGPDIAWSADPRAVLLRLGIVLLLLGACWQYARRYPAPRDTALLIVGRESLFVYVAHLAVLYAPLLAGRSLVQVLGQSFGPFFCTAVSLVLITAMAAAAALWGRWKLGRR